MSMKIISPGPLTTIQDLGRYGFMASGFSPSGAMDQRAARLASMLVDNDESDAVLEMTMMGIKAVFTQDNVIAVTGADFSPTIDGEPIEMYRDVLVKAGEVLNLSASKNGCRAYLAVAGGFDIPYVMNSFSTNLKCGIGGFEGRKLKAGDEIPLRYPQSHVYAMYKRKLPCEEMNGSDAVIRVVLGPQDDYFTPHGIETFLNEVYTVTNDSDRMGIKLDGAQIESKNGVDIISDGIALGSIQVPSSGKPIIMMADRQTTGGYAKIATIVGVDVSKTAQIKPQAKIRFVKISIEEAQSLCLDEKKALNKIRMALFKTR